MARVQTLPHHTACTIHLEYSPCHLYFVGIHTCLKACMYTKIQVTYGTFHSIYVLLENVA